MRDGRIDQLGTPTELYDRPRSAFVASFIGSQNFFAGRIAATGRLDADGGAVIAAARIADGAASGERGLGAVRPENVRLSAAQPAAATNKVLGRVVAIVMLGDMVEYVLRLPGGEELFSRLPRSASGLPELGHEVWAHWSPETATIFPFEALAVRDSGLVRRAAGSGQDG
jgi:ABC-type Fe3+/spermidine/putrescine transport system ATPase subunit